MTTRHILAIALLAAFAAGCSSNEDAEPKSHAGPEAESAAGRRSSSAGLPDGDIARGEKLATAKREGTGQACVDCHGPEGNAPIDASYPLLGGQYPDYLAHSLQQYRSGERSNALMVSQAKELTDQQIADIAAYFGSRPSKLVDLDDTTGVN